MIELQPCGTAAAYTRHLRRSEEPCDACREANSSKSKERRSDKDHAREVTQRNGARIKALWRLAKEYPERYRELSTEELLKLTFPENEK